MLAVVTLVALSTWSVAEPKKHDRAAHGAPPAAASQHKQSKKAKAAAAPQDKKHSKAKAAAVPQNKQRSKTKAVSEPNVTCNFPWDYSRA
ncbi:MAG TPA: hypothetical protein VFJ49_09480, partial [Methyloceanibacter sp.]|nr:hypothetical protein [Methyloceanibacter sp.]